MRTLHISCLLIFSIQFGCGQQPVTARSNYVFTGHFSDPPRETGWSLSKDGIQLVEEAGDACFLVDPDDLRKPLPSFQTSHITGKDDAIILKREADHYVLDCELMKKLTPSQDEIRAIVKSLLETMGAKSILHNGDEISPLIQAVLSQIYSGNWNAAWIIYEHAWPNGEFDEARIKVDLIEQLHKSIYWADLQMLNDGAASCATCIHTQSHGRLAHGCLLLRKPRVKCP